MTQNLPAVHVRRDLENLYLPEELRRELLLPFLPAGSAFCRRTAIRTYDLDVPLPDEQHGRFPLEVAVPTPREPLARKGVIAHSGTLPASDVVLVGTHPVTTIDRTLLDIARWAPRHQALAILDRAAAAGLLDKELLLERLTRLQGEYGVRWGRRLVRLADPGAESPMESFSRLRIADAGFEVPETQIMIPRPGGLAYWLDLGWRERKKAVEFDGVEPHASPEARRRDAARRAFIRGQGWEILVVDKGAVFGTQPVLENAVSELLGLPWHGRRRLW